MCPARPARRTWAKSDDHTQAVASPLMRIQFVALLLAASACTARPDESAAGPAAKSPTSADTSSPAFEVGIWPGEGIPVIHATSAQLQLHELPGARSPVRSVLQIKPGQRVSYDSTRYQTSEAGQVRVLAPARILGRDLGSIGYLSRQQYYRSTLGAAAVDVNPPAVFEYLQDRAEGTCFVRLNQRVIDANPCPTYDTTRFRVESPPKTLWWIHVRGPAQATGWLLLSDTSAKAVKRTY